MLIVDDSWEIDYYKVNKHMELFYTKCTNTHTYSCTQTSLNNFEVKNPYCDSKIMPYIISNIKSATYVSDQRVDLGHFNLYL